MSLEKASPLPGKYILSQRFPFFYSLASEIDLRNYPHLRLLQFNFHSKHEGIRKAWDNVHKWFNSICESVSSKSLVVEVRGFFEELGRCNKIQDTLLGLHTRSDNFSVYLPAGTEKKRMFPKLYEAGIVVEGYIGQYTDKPVGHCILSSYTRSSSFSCLASLSFPPMIYDFKRMCIY